MAQSGTRSDWADRIIAISQTAFAGVTTTGENQPITETRLAGPV
jgi:hypothetical protein